MEEIEAKFLEVDVKGLVSKLESFGAAKVFEGNIVAGYYDFKDGRLRRNRQLLRLRTKGDIAELTLKVPISNEKAKVAEEIEVNVSDADEMEGILAHLGIYKYDELVKHRMSYSLGGTHFDFDTYPGIPTFLEIEAPSIGEVESYAVRLGVPVGDAKPWNARELFEHYKKTI